MIPGLPTFVFVLFVPFSIFAFKTWGPAKGVAIVFLCASLFLPTRIFFDVTALPALNKNTAPTLCVLLVCLLFYRTKLAKLRLLRWPEVLAVVLIISSTCTALANRDPVFDGVIQIPGLKLWDIFNMASRDIMEFVLPFMFGILFYRTADDLEDLFRVLVVFAIIYTPFIILESALSPQINRWVYGFQQHQFAQHIRFGGYRPTVFMIHGLAVAFFICVSTLAAICLAQRKAVVLGFPAIFLAAVLFVVLVVCRSLAAQVYFLALASAIWFFSSQGQLRAASMIAIFVLIYPVLRAMDLFPADQLVELFSTLSERHSSSLAFRFEGEELLLSRALERPLLGWAGFNRDRILSEGGVLTIADGFWITRFSQRGTMGLLVTFSLLLVPIFVAARHAGTQKRNKTGILVGTLALIVAIYSLDLLPNGTSGSFPYLLAGALLSVSRNLRRPVKSSRNRGTEIVKTLQHANSRGRRIPVRF